MLNFAVEELEELTGPSASLSLCDLTVRGAVGSASSAGRSPNTSMMVVPSVAALLFAVSRVLSPVTRHSPIVFEAVASPFALTFRTDRKGVHVSSKGSDIDHGDLRTLAGAVRRDVVPFAERLISTLPAREPGVGDLRDALAAFATAARIVDAVEDGNIGTGGA